MRTANSGAITGEIDVPIDVVSNPLPFTGSLFMYGGLQESAHLTLDYFHSPQGENVTVECDLIIYGAEWCPNSDCDDIMDLFNLSNRDMPEGCVFFESGVCTQVMDISNFYGERVGSW
jgi:hypothetical protein